MSIRNRNLPVLTGFAAKALGSMILLVYAFGMPSQHASAGPNGPQPSHPTPMYQVRLHAIATSNDDGSEKTPYTASDVQNRIAQVNDIFYETGIQFEFDPDTDFEEKDATYLNKYFTLQADPADYDDPDVEPPSDAFYHNATRRALANSHRGKIVVFFSRPDKLEYIDSLGRWALVKETEFASSAAGRWVSINGELASAAVLAHELGHYLHSTHPFVDVKRADGDTRSLLQIAADRIRNAVFDGLPIDDGLDALDGDRAYVLDTPPDAGTGIWNEVYANDGGSCTTNHDRIDIDAGYWFPLYRLEPDRSLAMSYFFDCGFDNHFSPQQIVRMRDALENMNRHDLISLTSFDALRLERGGSGDAGAVDTVELIRVGDRRLVSVTVTNGTMKLIPWYVHEGTTSISRSVGDATAGPVSQVEALHTGLGNVLTAVRDGSGKLKLITWKVDTSGSNTGIQRLDEWTDEGVTQIAATRFDRRRVVTAVRTTGGTFKLILWNVDADGTIHRIREATVPGSYSIIDITPTPWGVTTSLRDAGNRLQVRGWHLNEEKGITSKQTHGAGYVGEIAATSLDFDNLLTTTVRTSSGEQKVIAWYVDYYGSVERRASEATPGSCSKLDSERLGVGSLVTACRDAKGNLRMSVFGIGSGGSWVQLYSTSHAGAISDVALARAGRDTVVSAVRTASGNLKLIPWRAEGLSW